MVTHARAVLTIVLSLGGSDVAGLPLAKDGQASYQNDTRTHGARRVLKLEEIAPGGYGLHELGPITITPDCIIWFSARSWETNLQLGERLFEPGVKNDWNAYVSLKFDGPTCGSKPNESLLAPADRIHYRGLAESDLVLVDRIILAKKRPL